MCCSSGLWLGVSPKVPSISWQGAVTWLVRFSFQSPDRISQDKGVKPVWPDFSSPSCGPPWERKKLVYPHPPPGLMSYFLSSTQRLEALIDTSASARGEDFEWQCHGVRRLFDFLLFEDYKKPPVGLSGFKFVLHLPSSEAATDCHSYNIWSHEVKTAKMSKWTWMLWINSPELFSHKLKNPSYLHMPVSPTRF